MLPSRTRPRSMADNHCPLLAFLLRSSVWILSIWQRGARQNHRWASTAPLDETRRSTIGSGYFCRADCFRSFPFSKGARGRIIMEPPTTSLEERRRKHCRLWYFCCAARFTSFPLSEEARGGIAMMPSTSRPRGMADNRHPLLAFLPRNSL